MLYIDKATILKFDLEMLKKHRRAIQFIAVLLFIVGLLCISFPFVSGDIKHSSGCIINLLGYCAYCRVIQQPQS